MRPRDLAFLTLGALAYPLGYNIGCRIAGRHHLSIKENT